VGGFTSLFAAALFTEMVGVLADGTPYPMIVLASGAAVCSLASATTVFATRKRI
jgi:hypothetical protein